MSRRETSLAIQFDKATLGTTIEFMRTQIIDNAEAMFRHPGDPILTFSVTLCEHQHLPYGPINPVYAPPKDKHLPVPFLMYAANLCQATDTGTRMLIQGTKESTIWAAYRSLLKVTMNDLGKRQDIKDGKGPRPSPSKSERVLGMYQ